MTALTAPLSRRTFVRWRTSAASTLAREETLDLTFASTSAPEETSDLTYAATVDAATVDMATVVDAAAEVPVEPAVELPAEVPVAVEAGHVSAPAAPARGAVFSGTKAQVRLAPSKASTHPVSGRRGDLFVDSTGRLWFCRTGGKTATWKQVKLV